MIRSALMNVMTAAALKAGRGLKRDFGEVENLQVSIKGPGDFVSAADLKAEKTRLRGTGQGAARLWLRSGGRRARRGHRQEHTWYIDPLDGTTNFLHGLPIFAISIGLEREGQIVAGLVYNPATDDMYIAEKGQGAYHNNRRLRVAARRDFSDALIGCGIPHLGKKGHRRLQGGIRRGHDPRLQSPPARRRGARSLLRRAGSTTASGSAASSPGTWRRG